jgi:hypothetical protein
MRIYFLFSCRKGKKQAPLNHYLATSAAQFLTKVVQLGTLVTG